MRGAYLFGRGRNLKVAQFISINLIALPRRRELEGRSRSGAKDGNRRPLNPIHIPRTFAAKCGSIQNGDIFLAMPNRPAHRPTRSIGRTGAWSTMPRRLPRADGLHGSRRTPAPVPRRRSARSKRRSGESVLRPGVREPFPGRAPAFRVCSATLPPLSFCAGAAASRIIVPRGLVGGKCSVFAFRARNRCLVG
jgi:hypothetical protein